MPTSPVQAGFHVEPGSGNFSGSDKMVPGGVEVHQELSRSQPYDMTMRGKTSIRVNKGYDYISQEYIGDEVEGVISEPEENSIVTEDIWQTAGAVRKRKMNESIEDPELNYGPNEKRSNYLEGRNPTNDESGSERMQRKSMHRVDNPNSSDSDRGKVIIITPEGTDIEKARFLDRSIKLYQILSTSMFGKVGYKNIKINFKKKIIVLVMNSPKDIGMLLKIDKLGQQKVVCSQPRNHAFISGVIQPIGLETTMEEFKEALSSREGQQNIQCYRINKTIKGKKIPTRNVRLIFEEPKLPDYIYLFDQRFILKPYVENVIQCFKCQAFGHIAERCFSKIQKCNICSGPHGL